MTDALSNTFFALADPTRRSILARLAMGEASVTELARPCKMSLPAVSKHLKVLERAGLISRGREAQWRPCKLEAGALKGVDDWLEQYRRFFEASFDRLEEARRSRLARSGCQHDVSLSGLRHPQAGEGDDAVLGSIADSLEMLDRPLDDAHPVVTVAEYRRYVLDQQEARTEDLRRSNHP